jgi:hypothetical protein
MPRYIKDIGKAFLIKVVLLLFLGCFFWGYKSYYPCAKIDIKKIYGTGLTDGIQPS